MRSLILLVSAAVLLVVPAAFAQSAYVGASVFGDIVRLSGSRSVFSDDTTSGEAIGITIRVGTPLGDRWGVEAEFARPSEIEDDSADGFFTPGFITISASPSDLSLPSILPPPRLEFRTTYRNTTFSTSAWIRQDFTARSALVYLAGLGFYRSERDFELSLDPRVLSTPISIFTYSSETIEYGVRPFVGIEGRIGLGEHAQLVPGLRLHGVESGWLVRPAIGVNWMF